MTTTATHPLPAVHTYETDDEMVIEVEVPDGERNIRIQFEAGALTVTVPVPSRKHHSWWNADATPC